MTTNIKRYVRVTDDSHPQYTVYEGRSLRDALTALYATERTLYAILGTGTVVHNLAGVEVEQEWIEGCPADNATAPDWRDWREK